MAERDIVFRIGNGEYGFDVQVVTAIEQMSDIVPVPNAPRCILGIMNLRGEVIPVFSLRMRFGMQEETVPELTRLIVASFDGTMIAFKVDEVLEMSDFVDEQLSKPPVITMSDKTRFIRLVANGNGKLVLLLDPSEMFIGDEAEQMKQVLESLNS